MYRNWRLRLARLAMGAMLFAICVACTNVGLGSKQATERPLEAATVLDQFSPDTLISERKCLVDLTAKGKNPPLRADERLHLQSANNPITIEGARPGSHVEIVHALECISVRSISVDSDPVEWIGINDRGEPVQPGTYFAIELNADGVTSLPLQLGVISRPDPCHGNAPKLLGVEIGPKHDGKVIELEHAQAVDLCVQVESLDGQFSAPAVDFGDTLLVDGRELDVPDYRVGVESHGGTQRFRIRGITGQVKVSIFGTPVPNPIAPPDSRFECLGRLYGFKHPFRAEPEPIIRRSNVVVRCDAVYQISESYPVYDNLGKLINVKTQTGHAFVPDFASTDGDGRFAVFITDSSFAATRRLPNDSQFIGLQVTCVDVQQCGTESYGKAVQQPGSRWNWGLFNVPDLAAGGLVARLITNGDRGSQGSIRLHQAERLLDNSASGPGRQNDYPVVVHESFDPLLEDGTQALVWLMAGQPTDHGKINENGLRIPGLATSSCEAPIVGPCIPFSDSCRDSFACDQARFTGNSEDQIRCHAPNLLLRLLASEYDVWLVDHVVENDSTYDIAFSSVLLYQKILNFPEPDEDRQLAVTGLSIGGVSTRIALRAWEFHAATGGEVDLPSGSRVKRWGDELYTDPDRVALFLSYDAPHLGARLPRTFQAYLKDDDLPGFSRFPALVRSKPAVELLQEFVSEDADTSCFGGQAELSSCDLSPSQFANIVNDDGISEMIEDSMDVLGVMAPGPIDGGTDGLPIRIPSVAIANGGLTRNLPSGQSGENRALKIEFGIAAGNPVHTLRAETRLLGSGLNTFCDATALSGDSGEFVWLAEALARDCWERTRGIKFKPLRAIARTSCIAALVGTSAADVFIGSPSSIKLDISVPMRPENASHYPTFVPTDSALLSRNGIRRGVDARWADWLAPEISRSHFTLEDDQCQFMMYHLDGHMKGDKDGFPTCENSSRSCLAGGHRPGNALDPGRRWNRNPDGFCDPNDSDAGVIPPEVLRARSMKPVTIDLDTLDGQFIQ
ncbi:MAG: hypothetical protein AB8B81_03685 [Halioglobus sp.]